MLQYQVVAGDSYSTITAKFTQCYGITATDIQAANPNVEPQQLQIGQVINILAQQTAPATDDSTTSHAIDIANCKGNWIWAWSAGSVVADANMGVAFSRWTKPREALSQSHQVLADLADDKYIGLGGGNDAGSWQAVAIAEVSKAICAGDFADYDGIVFDIEVGDIGLADNFATLFSETKQAGLVVLVSISHSAPYDISDAVALMDSFFASEHIDYLLPQLYTTAVITQELNHIR